MASNRIILIDDDPHIAKALGLFFRHEGMQIESRPTGREGLEALGAERFDLVLLDLDLPDIDGFAVLERLRSHGVTTPVIIVSGLDEEYNQLVGLGSGADDYITKPFSMPLLLSKVRALIRRSGVYANQAAGQAGQAGQAGPASSAGQTGPTGQADSAGSAGQAGGGVPAEVQTATLARGPFRLDRSSYRLTKNGETVSLTARELALFTLFMEHPGQVFSKAQLYEVVWDNPVVDENAVMVYVKRLRDKIEDDPSHPAYLQTLRGIGYRLVC